MVLRDNLTSILHVLNIIGWIISVITLLAGCLALISKFILDLWVLRVLTMCLLSGGAILFVVSYLGWKGSTRGGAAGKRLLIMYAIALTIVVILNTFILWMFHLSRLANESPYYSALTNNFDYYDGIYDTDTKIRSKRFDVHYSLSPNIKYMNTINDPEVNVKLMQNDNHQRSRRDTAYEYFGKAKKGEIKSAKNNDKIKGDNKKELDHLRQSVTNLSSIISEDLFPTRENITDVNSLVSHVNIEKEPLKKYSDAHGPLKMVRNILKIYRQDNTDQFSSYNSVKDEILHSEPHLKNRSRKMLTRMNNRPGITYAENYEIDVGKRNYTKTFGSLTKKLNGARPDTTVESSKSQSDIDNIHYKNVLRRPRGLFSSGLGIWKLMNIIWDFTSYLVQLFKGLTYKEEVQLKWVMFILGPLTGPVYRLTNSSIVTGLNIGVIVIEIGCIASAVYLIITWEKPYLSRRPPRYFP